MKKFFAILAVVALAFAACEPTDDQPQNNVTQGDEPGITLKSESTITINSGNTMGIISYTLVNPSEEYTVEATADVEWLNGFSYKDMGKISYRADRNPNLESRVGVITITYAEQSVEVTITQQGNPEPTNIVVEAPELTGHYYGAVQGLYNYYLVFTDKGMSSYEPIQYHNYFNVPDAYYYVIDLYLTTPTSNAKCTVPNGVYGFDRASQGWPDQFGHEFSWLQVNDAAGFPSSQTLFETGELKVEDGKITLTVVLYNENSEEETHTVIYEGDYSLVDMTGISYM